MSLREIGIKYKIPKPTVQHIVEDYGKIKKKAGRKEIISKLDKRHIRNESNEALERHEKCSTIDIIKKQDLKASKTTVWRSIKLLKYVYKKLPRKFKLSIKAKRVRVELCKEFI